MPRKTNLFQARESESVLDDPPALNYNFNTGEWHFQNPNERSRTSNYQEQWKNDEIFETVFSIIKGPVHEESERLSVDSPHKMNVALTKDNLLQEDHSAEIVLTINEETISPSSKSLLTYDHILSLGSIISQDPMKFAHDKMTSFDEQMMQLSIKPPKILPETTESGHHIDATDDQKRALAEAVDAVDDKCASSPYYCQVSCPKFFKIIKCRS